MVSFYRALQEGRPQVCVNVCVLNCSCHADSCARVHVRYVMVPAVSPPSHFVSTPLVPAALCAVCGAMRPPDSLPCPPPPLWVVVSLGLQ